MSTRFIILLSLSLSIMASPVPNAACNPAIVNCLACDDATATICESCVSGWYVDTASNTCMDCNVAIPGCQLCTVPNTCAQCQSGYYGSNTPICTKCNQFCTACTSDVSCGSCVDGHYPTIDQGCPACSVAMEKCQKCSSATVCEQCSSNYFPFASLPYCRVCSDLISGCVTCKSATVCTVCDDDKALNTDGTKCEDKSANLIIILAAVVSGLVLIAVGFAIFKCLQKKRGGSVFKEQDYEKL